MVDNFKQGDRVFDIRFGWGTVIVSSKLFNEVDVRFITNSNNLLFHIYKGESELRLLSFTEYILSGHTSKKSKPPITPQNALQFINKRFKCKTSIGTYKMINATAFFIILEHNVSGQTTSISYDAFNKLYEEYE